MLALVLLAPARGTASPDEDESCLLQRGQSTEELSRSLRQDFTSVVTFSTVPPWVTDQPNQCLTASDGGLALAGCDGGADQNLSLMNFHFLMYNGKCLEGNSTWADFVTCDNDNPKQWYQLPQVGSFGPIANCWCTGPSDCRKPCNDAGGVANSSSTKFLVIGDDPIWFWISFAPQAPTTESTTNQVEGGEGKCCFNGCDDANSCVTSGWCADQERCLSPQSSGGCDSSPQGAKPSWCTI